MQAVEQSARARATRTRRHCMSLHALVGVREFEVSPLAANAAELTVSQVTVSNQ